MKNRRLYFVWWGMLDRCSSKARGQSRKNWYLRGIRVCEEWKNFSVFEAWALSNGYAEGLQIDRFNNDKGYNSDNCRWTTHQINSQNRRTSKLNFEDVVRIKGMLSLGYSQKCLTSMFPITSGPMSRIANGTRWGNVEIFKVLENG